MESLLATLFVFALDRADEKGSRPDAGTQAVARAIEYIHAHLTDAISLADIAAEAQVSARSLQRAFNRALGRTPLRYLRDSRLQAANRTLSVADPVADTITQIAYRCGFLHLSRFAEAYRAEFGERRGITPHHHTEG